MLILINDGQDNAFADDDEESDDEGSDDNRGYE